MQLLRRIVSTLRGRLAMSSRPPSDTTSSAPCSSSPTQQPDSAAKRRGRPPLSYTDDFETPSAVSFEPIGIVRSPYKERFGTPRQPNVTENTLGNSAQGFNPLVTPPRGPRKRQGVLATRSPHRPNSIGLSCIHITSVDEKAGVIHVLGLDLLDGTPVLDIKPYVPYCDSFPNARAGWLDQLNEDMKAPDKLNYDPPPAHLMRQIDNQAAEPKNHDSKTTKDSGNI